MIKRLLVLALLLFSAPVLAQFNAASSYATVNNACGQTFNLQGGFYYDVKGVQSSSLPTCAPSAGSVGSANGGVSQIFVTNLSTASVGAVALNAARVRVNLGAGASSLVITDSLATAASTCIPVFSGSAVDVTATSVQCQPGAGTMTLRTNASATAQVQIDVLLIN